MKVLYHPLSPPLRCFPSTVTFYQNPRTNQLISPPLSFLEMLSIDRNLLSLSASRASCPGDKFRPDHCNHSGNQDHAAEHADEHPHGQQEPHFRLKP